MASHRKICLVRDVTISLTNSKQNIKLIVYMDTEWDDNIHNESKLHEHNDKWLKILWYIA